MAKIKYYYDTETCKYERIKVKTSDVVFNFLGFLLLSSGMGLAFVFLYFSYFESPKEVKLQNEVAELKYYYEALEGELKNLNNISQTLEYNDNEIYRVILGADPIHSSIRNAGVGGTDRYKDIRDGNFESSEMVVNMAQQIDQVKRKLYIQKQSYDEIAKLVSNKEKMLASIPAIQPISNDELIRLASGFGLRIHPVYKVKKLHTGIDFSAPTGTPIYATADGVISTVEVSFSGYGKQIEINHGFGFVTKYAHMQEFVVKKNQKVKRGELIGYVGNTGLSTAPHLHYEVIRNGEKVNPVHYFFNDLSPAEYERVVELASIENQSLGM